MDDFYFVVSLYNPISTSSHLGKVLSSLGSGFVIPFDSKNPDFNNYVYVGESVYSNENWRRSLNSLCGDFEDLGFKAPKSQIEKFISNVSDDNNVRVGDVVIATKVWKTLPLEVKEIVGDKARVFHEMRGESLDDWIPIRDLQIAESVDDSKIYKIKKFVEDRDHSLVIDCDSFSGNGIVTLKDFLTTMVRVKLYYPRHRVIVLNPDETIQSILKPMSIEFGFGSILYYCDRDKCVVYSDNILLRCMFENIVYVDKELIVENWYCLKDEDKRLRVVMSYLLLSTKCGISRNKLHRDSHMMVHKMSECELEEFKSFINSEIVVDSKEPFLVQYELDTDLLYSEFEKRGLSYFGDGIYNLIDLLRG